MESWEQAISSAPKARRNAGAELVRGYRVGAIRSSFWRRYWKYSGLTRKLSHSRIEVVRMNDYFPFPPVRFCRGKTRILMPSLIEVFLAAVRPSGPHKRRNCIDDGL